MLKKAGQGLSITTIIIGAIALIVLVVLIAIFTGRFGLFSKGLESCLGECSKTPCTGASIPGTDCKKQGKGDYCCIMLGSEKEGANVEKPYTDVVYFP